ncbi:MAG: alpha-N-acetylglucosaminidase [Ruminococcaceae bacterium]|nr:alpha-N-acetylglucosaminidase [Oscillospiraceae bacterium]
MKPIFDLIERKLPGASENFVIEAIASEGGLDTYEIEKKDGKVVLRGSGASALALALGYFIKHILDEDLSWSNLDCVFSYRDVDFAPYRKVVDQKYRSYMNFCTHSYTCAWWSWERWEKEIDIMALCGVNLPLSITGSEAIWYYTMLDLGFTDEESREYVGGPAFYAWFHMGNIESFSGPVPKAWLESHIEMGKKIMDREISLGMMPIQQGFTGCVPTSFIERFPENNILLKKKWNNISHTAQLDPTDPLFTKIGDIYMNNMEKLFGLHGCYAADPFHEGYPPVDGPEYLVKVGNIINDLMARHDKNYKWIMQSWSIRKEIATTVPKGHLVVLDLAGTGHTRTDGFWGYDFLTGSLHNFGARMNLHGDIDRLASNTFLRAREISPHISGTGLFMEGIGQNPLYYDLAFDVLTSSEKVDLDEWFKGYCRRRYKSDDPALVEAVRFFADIVYAKNSDNVLDCASLICARPSLHAKGSGPCDNFDESYDNDRLFEAARMFAKFDSDARGMKYDKCDILRQALSNYALKIYRETIVFYESKNLEAFKAHVEKFKGILLDLDELTYQIEEWRMKTWIDDALEFAANEDDADLLEYNAREQVTIWGNEEECVLFDYAWKEWSGLISDYYLARWTKFFDMLTEKLENGEEYTEEGLPEFENRITWNANEFRRELAKWEVQWIHSRNSLPVYAEDMSIYDKLLEKYSVR